TKEQNRSTTIINASSSQINNDGDDHIIAVQTSPHREHNTVLSPVGNTEKLVPETDPRDGLETSISSKDGEDLQ
ncbi:hypothetical protein A2U01_0079678, partial [Trifolium medium]|nr:hypothetical protein [Trifolium medium]